MRRRAEVDWIAERSEWADTPNLCSECHNEFRGHKQRHVCVACASELREKRKRLDRAKKKTRRVVLLALLITLTGLMALLL
jgi:uncharacterized paraquat-inducible protein A